MIFTHMYDRPFVFNTRSCIPPPKSSGELFAEGFLLLHDVQVVIFTNNWQADCTVFNMGTDELSRASHVEKKCFHQNLKLLLRALKTLKEAADKGSTQACYTFGCTVLCANEAVGADGVLKNKIFGLFRKDLPYDHLKGLVASEKCVKALSREYLTRAKDAGHPEAAKLLETIASKRVSWNLQ